MNVNPFRFGRARLGLGLGLYALGLAAHAQTVVFQESFTGGLGQFTSSGSVTVGNSGASMAGSFGGTDGSVISIPINTQGFTSLTLSYDRVTSGLDSGEAGIAEYTVNGSTFTAVESIRTASGRVSFNLAQAATNQTALRLRFRISASLSSESYAVDNIRLEGVNGEPPPPPPPPPPPTGFQRGPDPTVSSLEASAGPFAVATTTVASGSGFGGGTIYYPTNTTEGPFAAIVVAPGFTETQSNVNWWGPRLASHGFVVITINTNSTSDQPASRATQMIAALNRVVTLSQTSGNPIFGKVDPNRRGVMGHSMGGGGTLIAARDNPSLKAAIPFAPWNSSTTNFSGIQVPTMIIACENDSIAQVSSHASPFYNSLTDAIKKAFLEIAGGSHSCANSGNSNTRILGKYGVSWMKRFMDEDTRYSPFLCGAPHQTDLSGSTISEYRDNCPY